VGDVHLVLHVVVLDRLLTHGTGGATTVPSPGANRFFSGQFPSADCAAREFPKGCFIGHRAGPLRRISGRRVWLWEVRVRARCLGAGRRKV
jgi:hypothetical protein